MAFDNADIVKRLEAALEDILDIHTEHHFDTRHKNEAIQNIESVIKDVKNQIDDGR